MNIRPLFPIPADQDFFNEREKRKYQDRLVEYMFLNAWNLIKKTPYRNDRELIRSVAHDSALKTFKARVLVNTAEKPSAYVQKIIKRTFFDSTKSFKRNKIFYREDFLNNMLAADDLKSKYDLEEQKTTIKKIKFIVSRLSSKDQKLFHDLYILNKTNKDISEDDGKSDAQVGVEKIRLHKKIEKKFFEN